MKYILYICLIKLETVINTRDFIIKTFLLLTSETYPYGTEDLVVDKMVKEKLLPDYIQKDQHGNYFLKIGDTRTIFASHLDTVCKEQVSVVHNFDGDIVRTDEKTNLGADDKAGVTIMLWMILNNIPGLYYFFIGEEVGCIGSGLASKYGDFKGKYDRIISFDRKGTDSVITYQSSSRCCSDEFASDLANNLNKSGLSYRLDDTGVYTDSAEFVSVIPECTNLSVGYYKEHTVKEHQDINHLIKLANACLLVNWESLKTKRDMTKTEYKSNLYSMESCSDYNIYNYNKKRKRKKKSRYYDDWYDQNNSFSHNNNWTSFVPGKSYYDFGEGAFEVKKTIANYSSYSYDWIMSKFLNKKLSHEDLEKIKEQYLDMDIPNDREFYIYLLEIVRGGN